MKWTADQLVELDLNTHEKLPVLEEMVRSCSGPALDVGAGLAFYARRLLRQVSPAVAVDLDLSALLQSERTVHLGLASADRLPFRDASFGCVLLTDVLEHCPDDAVVLREVRRLLRPDGRLLLTVPSMELGFPDFLSLLQIESVHDQEGPEHHYRPGYRQVELQKKLEEAGFEVVEVRQIMRFGGKLMIDAISLAHLFVERIARKRTSWTWGALLATPPPGLRFYRALFPAVRGLHKLVHRLGPRRGFELAVMAAATESAAP